MKDTYQTVTDRIIAMLEDGTADPAKWRKSWQGISNGQRNATGRAYRGINTLLLAAANYDEPVWGTFKQWNSLGGKVRKGEKATTVVLWKKVHKEDEEGKKKSFMILRGFNVFNWQQIDGIDKDKVPAFKKKAIEINSDERVAEYDEWIAATNATIEHNGGDRAYYRPISDSIHLPRFEDFETAMDYYATTAHELAHWTGHKNRLERDLSGRFGDLSYAAEELVAELSSAFSMARLGAMAEPRADHAHYIKSWIQLLKDDKRAIITASSKAQAATDFLFGDSQEEPEMA